MWFVVGHSSNKMCLWGSILISDSVEPVQLSILLGGKLELSCPAPSNLAKLIWKLDDVELPHSPQDGPLILNGSASNAGRYRCSSVERSQTDNFNTIVADYLVSIDPIGSGKGVLTSVPQPQSASSSHTGLIVVIILLAGCLILLLTWKVFKRHVRLPWNRTKRKSEESHQDQDTSHTSAPLVAESANKNHTGTGGVSEGNNTPRGNLSSMQYIDDESAI